jgi:hypothetical protein
MSVSYDVACFKHRRQTRFKKRTFSLERLLQFLAMERYHPKSQHQFDRGYHYIEQYMLALWEMKGHGLPSIGDQWGLKMMCDKILMTYPEQRRTTDGKKYVWNQMHRAHRDIFKARLSAWSPTVYKPGVQTRSNAGVEAVNCIVLDMDKGITWDEAVPAWAALHHAMVAHTTISHCNLHGARFRIILPLATPCPADIWPRLWQWAYERSGRTADKAAKDASRIFYLNWTPLSESASQVFVQREEPLAWRELTLPKPREVKRVRVARHTPRHAPVVGGDLLNQCAKAREEKGYALGGVSNGKTISKMTCPGCGRASLWFWIEPHGMLKAKCNHENSCGHTAWLDQLRTP